MVVLGEAAAAPPWVMAIFVIAGAIAVWGVVGLARYHPQVLSESQELGIARGSTSPDTAQTTPAAAGTSVPPPASPGTPGATDRPDNPEDPREQPWRSGSPEQP